MALATRSYFGVVMVVSLGRTPSRSQPGRQGHQCRQCRHCRLSSITRSLGRAGGVRVRRLTHSGPSYPPREGGRVVYRDVGPDDIAAIKQEIQNYADLIQDMASVPTDDPWRAAADKVIADKSRIIRCLMMLVPTTDSLPDPSRAAIVSSAGRA